MNTERQGNGGIRCANAIAGLQTMLNCIDNSGAAVVECANVLKKKRAATVGGCSSTYSASISIIELF